MSLPKTRVAVLYGGRSGEHEVSLQSAVAVIKNLDPARFEIVPIGIDKQGRWLLNDVKQLGINAATKALPLKTVNSELLSAPQESGLFDVVFPVLHGVLCEDGTVQGMLELMDVPYVGAGVLASAIGMDKDVSKRLVAAAGLRVPSYTLFNQAQWQHETAKIIDQIETQWVYPLFVKPVNTGSSVGVHKVNKREELIPAINDAFLYDTRITVEQGLQVREIELAVLENPHYGQSPLVSIPGEIVPHHAFYSYAAKYLDPNGAEALIPAPLSPAKTEEAKQIAGKIFEVLGCEGMARVDLFLDKNSDEFVFNEVNTLPGFTQISMYPKLWEASGISYQQLLTYLIELAIARYQRKQGLKRDWAIST